MTVIDTIRQHRSIRQYKPDPVPDDLLTEILEAGVRTSSSGNMQTYSIIVTRDEALREQLYSAHMEQHMVLEAPVFLTFCADFNRMRHWLRLSEAPHDAFDNLMGFMEAAIDAILVSQNVALAAESHGLGICYLGSTLAHCNQVGRILCLPDHVVPVVGFPVGYPAEDPAPRDRLPLAGLLHHETYHDYSDDQIRDIYREREVKGWDRYMSYPDLRQLIEESGVKNLAQVYTIVKYTRTHNERWAQNIRHYLEEQGF
jgi:nitroreductase